MKLRRVQEAGGSYSIEALIEGSWRRLSEVSNLADIAESNNVKGDLAVDLLSVLALGNKGWRELELALNDCSHAPDGSTPVMPFAPSSFRDFMLFEKHFMDSAKGHVQRYMPGAAKVAGLYEKVTGKTFPMFKPKTIWYQQPLYYFGNHLNFLTDGDEIPWPSFVNDLDYELELAAIIARPVIDATPEEAAQAIGGFVLINDVSSRGDGQRNEMASGFGPQKCKHFANSMATTVVTADEVLGRESQLQGRVRINDQVVAECSSAGMQFSFTEVVSFLCQGEQLHPGELLGSGTLPGAAGLENGQWLQPGDRLTLELDGVGTLSNSIAG